MGVIEWRGNTAYIGGARVGRIWKGDGYVGWKFDPEGTVDAARDAPAALDALEAAAVAWLDRAGLVTRAERDAAVREVLRNAEHIRHQVEVTRAYAKDCGMTKNQVDLMETCTSHFLDYARAIERALAAQPKEGV